MLQKFQNHLESHFPFLKKKAIFLAVSGGLDSMVLLHLFQQLSYKIGILHCNFNLRGNESDADTIFVESYANTHSIPISIAHFDTEIYSKTNKVSIQVAARELRYNWFAKETQDSNFDYVATAHHADDDIETFLINLSRGTGIAGLTGIPAINKHIIRPLLPFSRVELEHYAKENNILWREDLSNASTKYLRNKIRHEIVPILKQLHPSFLKNFQKTQGYLVNTAQVAADYSTELAQKNIHFENEVAYFEIASILKIPNSDFHLHHWLQPYGFTAWEDISQLLFAQTGKKIESKTHILVKDREQLILFPKIHTLQNESYFIKESQSCLNEPINLTISEVNNIRESTNNVIFVAADDITFPLEIRKIKEGDFFYPAGMQGKKKVSKYFKDEKFSLLEKENQWLLVSNNEIVWIIGKRADNRFVAKPTNKNILKIEIIE